MLIPLIGFLVLATPWVGSWKLELEGSSEILHLVVKDATYVELYDDSWTPHEIQEIRLEDDQFEIRALIMGSAQLLTLRGQRNEDKISGTITLKYPQFPITKTCHGERVSLKPFPEPVDWIARHREEDCIDIIRYCVNNAPRDDFESFIEFWEEEVETSFYIFLHLAIAEIGDPVAKRKVLQNIFTHIDSYTEGCLDSLISRKRGSLEVGSNSTRSGSNPTEPVDTAIDCLVLIPPITAKETTLRLSSIKNKVPPGVRPCCGESLYDLENFLLTPVSCVKTTKDQPPTEKPPEKAKQN